MSKRRVRRLLVCGVLQPERLARNKGATVILYKGKHYYVWRDKDAIYFQKKWPWSNKHRILFAAISE